LLLVEVPAGGTALEAASGDLGAHVVDTASGSDGVDTSSIWSVTGTVQFNGDGVCHRRHHRLQRQHRPVRRQ